MSVGIWSRNFYLMDEDGEYSRDKDGSICLYDLPKMDYSIWTEHLSKEDLRSIPSEYAQYDNNDSPEDYQHHTSNINYKTTGE